MIKSFAVWNNALSLCNKSQHMNTIIYKGIEIKETENGYYIFDLLGVTYLNTNIHFAKRMVTRMMKYYGLIK